jgi:DNA-binding Lrp family transcriptional regulator
LVTAFVLINVQDKNFRRIADNLLAMPGVKEVHVVAGEYDMVAVLRVTDNQELSQLITERMVHAPGVQRTKTLFALHSFSPFDLDALFRT